MNNNGQGGNSDGTEQGRSFDQWLARRRESQAKASDSKELQFDEWLEPIWIPDPQVAATTQLGRWMTEQKCDSVTEFHQWTVDNRSDFWTGAIEKLNLGLGLSLDPIAANSSDVENICWLPKAKFNIATACLVDSTTSPAIKLGRSDGSVETVSRHQLSLLVDQIANGLIGLDLPPQSKIATVMTMNVEAVACYLATIKLGHVAVSIAESFAAPEIESRLRIADVGLVLTAGFVRRGTKSIPLYERVVAANAPRTVVLRQEGEPELSLRESDLWWSEFVSNKAITDQKSEPTTNDANAPINILFSSGTTGDPKAIVWTQLTPLKCAVDAMLLHDVGEGDVVCWPTSLGWMMGPWLIFASLLNKATIALYEDAPLGKPFGQFVSDAKVTMLGVVPTLVKAWRSSRCMESLDWSRIRAFSSTGEASTAEDMFYLSYLADSKPIIEYCGGTEIGGGYMSSTMVQPNLAAAFSTPAFGIDIVILDDDHQAADEGQLFLVPPSIGLSQQLLNRDHHATYFADVPVDSRGRQLRKHGDFFVRLAGGYYSAGGRADDTMNLGGIKVSSVEIERVLNQIESIRETAAVAVSDEGRGPSQLVVFFVNQNTASESSESKSDSKPDTDHLNSKLLSEMNGLLKKQLNPLFKIAKVVKSNSLPRTASNKIMRRVLRKSLDE